MAKSSEASGITEALRRALSGDEGGLDALFVKIGPLIEAVARCRVARSLGSSEGWPDVASSVSLALLRKLRRDFTLEDGASGHRSLLGLLSKITSDVVNDRLRELHRNGVGGQAAAGASDAPDPMDQFAATVTTAWRRAERGEGGNRLRAALASLSQRDRFVLVLRGVDAIPFRTIGAQLDISEDAARMAFGRAASRIKEALPRELYAALGSE